jgi:hypothetical protein
MAEDDAGKSGPAETATKSVTPQISRERTQRAQEYKAFSFSLRSLRSFAAEFISCRDYLKNAL